MAELFDRKCSTQKEYLHTLLQSGNFLCHPSALVRKSVLDKIGYFNLLYRQLADYDLWLRIVSEAEITVLEERLIRFQDVYKRQCKRFGEMPAVHFRIDL